VCGDQAAARLSSSSGDRMAQRCAMRSPCHTLTPHTLQQAWPRSPGTPRYPRISPHPFR
jgi:hypothetical protein